MVSQIEFLIEHTNIPYIIGIVIIALFLCMQLIGECLEFKGKVVPEIMKVRKYFARKKREREVLSELPLVFEDVRQVPAVLEKVQTLLNNVDKHYSEDNITKRDGWIKNVDTKLDCYDKLIQEIGIKLDKNNEDTLSLLIESKRSTIINFASYVADESNPVTKEQFRRIFKVHKEYEKILANNNMTNGETDTAMRIIRESYEQHMRHHTFIEDIRGYDINV